MSTCAICNKTNISIRDNLCQFCKAEQNGIDANYLKKLYFEDKLSVVDIGKKLGYPTSTMYKIFKHFKVDRKSFSEAATLSESKRIKTRLERYGYSHNFNKNCDSRNKWENKLFEEEGIVNVFQRTSVKKKSNETILKKYKTENWKHSLTVRGNGIVSKLNKIVFKILEDADIDFEIEFKLKNPKANYYAYDILLNNNKIIEINGDYWHGNPKIYKASDLLLKGSSGEITYKEKWKKDKKKIKLAKKNGYKVLIIWEYDLKNNYSNTVNKIIKYARSKNKKNKKIKNKV